MIQVGARDGVLAVAPLPDLGIGRRFEPPVVIHHFDAVVVVGDGLRILSNAYEGKH